MEDPQEGALSYVAPEALCFALNRWETSFGNAKLELLQAVVAVLQDDFTSRPMSEEHADRVGRELGVLLDEIKDLQDVITELTRAGVNISSLYHSSRISKGVRIIECPRYHINICDPEAFLLIQGSFDVEREARHLSSQRYSYGEVEGFRNGTTGRVRYEGSEHNTGELTPEAEKAWIDAVPLADRQPLKLISRFLSNRTNRRSNGMPFQITGAWSYFSHVRSLGLELSLAALHVARMQEPSHSLSEDQESKKVNTKAASKRGPSSKPPGKQPPHKKLRSNENDRSNELGGPSSQAPRHNMQRPTEKHVNKLAMVLYSPNTICGADGVPKVFANWRKEGFLHTQKSGKEVQGPPSVCMSQQAGVKAYRSHNDMYRQKDTDSAVLAKGVRGGGNNRKDTIGLVQKKGKLPEMFSGSYDAGSGKLGLADDHENMGMGGADWKGEDGKNAEKNSGI